jgi:hypothetical protein
LLPAPGIKLKFVVLMSNLSTERRVFFLRGQEWMFDGYGNVGPLAKKEIELKTVYIYHNYSQLLYVSKNWVINERDRN